MPTAPPPLKVNQKVHALKDLLGVPRGTTGKVLLVKGLEWKRYWVDFDNGVSVPAVDRGAVGTKDEWRRAEDGAVVTESVAVAADDAATADAAPEGESVGGIPFHLLERSRRARERLAAKG